MADAVDMSPDSSPGTPAGSSGVRRVNNLPIYILCVLLAGFLLIMALVAADRAEKQQRPPDTNDTKATSANMFASELAGQEKDGIIPAAKAAPLIPPDSPAASAAAPVAHPEALEMPPLPPGAAQSSAPAPQQDPRALVAMEKMHMLEEAIKAKTTVQVMAPRSAGSAPIAAQRSGAVAPQQNDMPGEDDPTAMYQARVQQLRQAGLVAASGASTGNQSAAPSEQGSQMTASSGKNYGQFDGGSQQDRWRLDSQTQAPRSPYEIRASFVLPAILISGINSDLPGQVIGQVSQDVFDTATGRWKLIPQGSRLIGQYSSEVAYGQARVLIAWQRIVFPDGKALDIGAMPGADSAGYAGFHDQVNNHYLRVFGSALLMSGVTAGIALSQPDSLYSNRQSARSAMSEALGQQLGTVTAQMISKNMGISPTLEIRPGYRFNVVVTKDLTFSKPYKAFDY